MKIGIVGSRRRNEPSDFEIVKKKLLEIFKDGDIIISGGCKRGADGFAEILVDELKVAGRTIDKQIFPADWKKHGRAAGFIRNTDIARESEVLIACVAPDRTGGTEDTVKKFHKMHPGATVYLV